VFVQLEEEKEEKATLRDIVMTTFVVLLTMFSACVAIALLVMIAKKLGL